MAATTADGAAAAAADDDEDASSGGARDAWLECHYHMIKEADYIRCLANISPQYHTLMDIRNCAHFCNSPIEVRYNLIANNPHLVGTLARCKKPGSLKKNS